MYQCAVKLERLGDSLHGLLSPADMDEGTLKKPTLNVVFSGHFCLGWCRNFEGS